MSLLDQIPVPAGINSGLSRTRNRDAVKYLGFSRDAFYCHPPNSNHQNKCFDDPSCNNDPHGRWCPPPTVKKFKHRVITRNMGKFSVSGFDEAVKSLKNIIRDIKSEQREVYDILNQNGMLCCRRIAGSETLSNHAWGMAIDFKLSGVVDPQNNGKTLRGLALIAPIFHRHKWYWGAGFSREDSMHFEVSRQLLRKWANKGKLIYNDGSGANPQDGASAIVVGSSRNRPIFDTVNLHDMLNGVLGVDLDRDAEFGPNTRAALLMFQHDTRQKIVDGKLRQPDWELLVKLTKRNMGDADPAP